MNKFAKLMSILLFFVLVGCNYQNKYILKDDLAYTKGGFAKTLITKGRIKVVRYGLSFEEVGEERFAKEGLYKIVIGSSSRIKEILFSGGIKVHGGIVITPIGNINNITEWMVVKYIAVIKKHGVVPYEEKPVYKKLMNTKQLHYPFNELPVSLSNTIEMICIYDGWDGKQLMTIFIKRKVDLQNISKLFKFILSKKEIK